MSGLYWLKLKDGRTVMGTKAVDRLSWAYITDRGSFSAADDLEVLWSKKIPAPVFRKGK